MLSNNIGVMQKEVIYKGYLEAICNKQENLNIVIRNLLTGETIEQVVKIGNRYRYKYLQNKR